MRVGYYSPLPPERSGIADYSALLLPALERRLDVEVVRPGRRWRRQSFDLPLYHIGNNPEAHGWILAALRERRGLVVLHEFVLHHLVVGVTLGRGDAPGYLDAMQREAGVVGRLLAHGVIDGLVPPLWERRPADFPLAREVLDHADGLIVHSRYVEESARAAGYTGPIWLIPHPTWVAPPVRPYELGRSGRPVVAAVGNLNPNKRLPQLLEAFARLRLDHPEALLVIAGSVAGVDLEYEVERFGVGDAVILLGYTEERDLWSVLATADVSVNLRDPTMGETSGIALRALAAGRPLVVSNVGWFAELPDSVAIKIPVGADEVEQLSETLARLAADADLRERMGEAARDLAEREHDLERVADMYASVCETSAGLPAAESAVMRQVAVAAADVGITPESPAVQDFAAAVREVTRGD